jgi:hypothetical protein
VTVQEILQRAGTQTCGGCHQYSENADIAPAKDPFFGIVTWPASLGFVHADENGQQSRALIDRMLPERARHLQEFSAAKTEVTAAPVETMAAMQLIRAAPATAAQPVSQLRRLDRAKPGVFGIRPVH